MKIFLNYLETGFRPVSIIVFIAMLTSCSGRHLINNSQYLDLTEKAFNSKRLLAENRDSALFTVFNRKLSPDQSEALKFLYAYMPLNDLADYNGDFFLANINSSLRTRTETSWGKNIPEDIFLHYVLPCRINNENLDSFRISYYDELMARVKGKDIRDAALEVNHWCHERVNYQPADIRTSAPMSTILSARGRCGEESTLTVAALRTVGIPARQVYTPRWAHTDDNHAWVEIWIDGAWCYMGACEPEAVLDRGWFTEPARRAMLIHTKSFGAFSGSENAINISSNFTDVNNLNKYAVSRKIYVKVLDAENKPVKSAKVEFQLYNYAEFYPLAIIPSDEKGISQFETGLGDLIIWAHKDDNFDFKKISVAETDTITLNLHAPYSGNSTMDMDLDVPIIRSPLPEPSKDLISRNSERIKQENIIREKYTGSWMKPGEAKNLALSLKIDTTRVINNLTRSMGNFKEISSFLSEVPQSLLPEALSLLDVLQDKDLRDVKKDILIDHLSNCKAQNSDTSGITSEIFKQDILNPRVANEMIVPWRHYFLTKLPPDLKLKASGNPSLIVKYLGERIKIADDENYYETPLTPIGVNELKVSDRASRAICFVAICRSLGIASRLEPGSNIPQYFENNIWKDVYFSDQKQADQNKGYIKLLSNDLKPVPEYYIQFTLARFEDGRYNTLEYDYNKKITDFREELSLRPGHYMLVTGNRLASGRILSNISFFDLNENEHKSVEVKIRKDVTEKRILGKIDLEKFYKLTKMPDLAESCTRHNGLVIIWVDPEKEPTKHIFNDLPQLKTELDAWGGNILFLGDAGTFDSESLKGLPANSSFHVDNQMAALKACVVLNSPSEINLPVVIVTDNEGDIFFESTGYRVGIGEQILKYIR